MVKTAIVLVLLGGIALALGWGLVKLYFLAKEEADEDRQNFRAAKRGADEAIDDLEWSIERAERKNKGKKK